MADKLMYIPNHDTQNHPLFILLLVVETSFDIQFNETTNQNSFKVPKDNKPTYKKLLL